MKLYDVPRRSWVRVKESNPNHPPGSKLIRKNEELFFDHIDGMYSYCKDINGELVHIGAWTEVEVIKPPPLAPIEDTFKPAP